MVYRFITFKYQKCFSFKIASGFDISNPNYQIALLTLVGSAGSAVTSALVFESSVNNVLNSFGTEREDLMWMTMIWALAWGAAISCAGLVDVDEKQFLSLATKYIQSFFDAENSALQS
jgi:hypothetical protein